jgi:Spy/CpxP family protein refolding chaperone
MSHIRTTLAAALLTFGGVAVASAQQPASTPHAHAGHNGHKGARRFAPGRNAFLRGITLSDAEKANLKTVNAQHASQMKALRAQNKPQMDAMRTARQNGDTAALRAFRDKSKGERGQMRQLIQSQQADVRGALSPENQARFDANVAAFQKRAADHTGKGRRPRFQKPGI